MSNFQNKSTTNQSLLNALLIISALAVLALIYMSSANGLRGTDQYQYAADAETLRKNQPALTNLFFPAKIVRNQAVQEDTNYFSHNGPLLHIVAKSTRSVDVQTAWVLLNCLFHMITALAIYSIAKSLTSLSIATVVTALYIASPIAYWQASNVLQEQFFGALVALCLIGYYFRENAVAIALLPLCYFIGALSHPIFVLTGLLHGLSLVILSLTKRKFSLALVGIVTLLIIFVAKTFGTHWFPTQFQPGLKEIITSAIPDYSNMVYHFQPVQPDITPELLLDKLTAAIKKQFFSVKDIPFFIFTNIAGFCLLYLLYASLIQRKINLYVVAPLAILFGAYTGMIVLQQNHARFQQIISPATFLILALLIHRIRFNLVTPLVFAILPLVAVDTVYAQYLRKQAMLQSTAINEFSTQVGSIIKNAKIVSVDIRAHGALAYALRPNKVLTINTRLMDSDSILSAVEMFDAEFVLVQGNNKLLLSEDLSLQAELDSPHFGKLKLYQY